MKKILVLTFAFLLFSIISIFSVNSFNQKGNENLTDLLKVNTAYGENFETAYIRSAGPCSITVHGKAGITVTIWGVRYTIPAEGSITVTKSGQEIVCSSGGTSSCTPRDC